MAQQGEFRFENNVWSGYTGSVWEVLPDEVQAYLTQNFDGVSGSGTSQVFSQKGTNSVVPLNQVKAGVVAAFQGTSQPSGNQPSNRSTVSQETLRDHWNRFMPGTDWPPLELSGEVNTQLLNSFLQSLRVMGVPGFADPQTFELTDAQGRVHMYGQAPGSTSVIDLGVKGEAGTGTPQAVDIGGQQYFQQPGADGQFERIPQAEGAGAAPSIQTIGGIQFINQGGQLVHIDIVMRNMNENMVVTGDFQGASAVHQWETRPSNQDYFNDMLKYVNAPADQLLISAIARGQGLVAPPPEETIPRIGPPPDYLTAAFNMYRDQMQMGQPGEGESYQSIMAQRADERQAESEQIANDTARFQLESSRVQADDTHKAAVTANANAQLNNETVQLNNETVQFNNEKMFMESAPGLQDVFSTDTAGDDPAGEDMTREEIFDKYPFLRQDISKLPVSRQPQMKEYNDVAADFANTGFQFGEVRGISREDMAGFINSLSPEQRKLAEQQFKDQGGLKNAGAFFDSVAGLENALNFHLKARGMDTVDLDNSGDDEVAVQQEGDITIADGVEWRYTDGNWVKVEADETSDGQPDGSKIVQTDTPKAIKKTIDVGEEGVDAAVGDLDPSPTMSQADIFRKYPFLAPEGWGGMDIPTETRPAGPMSEEEMDIYGSTLGPTEAEMDIYGSTIPEPYQRGQTRREAMQARDIAALKDPAGIVSGFKKARDFVGSIPGIQDIPFENISGDVRRRKADEAIRNQMVDIPTPEPATVSRPVDVGPGRNVGGTVDWMDQRSKQAAIRDYLEEEEEPFVAPELPIFGGTVGAANIPAPVTYGPDVVTATPAGVGAPVPEDPDDYAGRWYDEGAYGVRTGSKPTLVGESGPELALFPNGTEIVPLDRRMKPSQARRLRRRGIRGMQEGGIVFGPDQYRARGGEAGVRALPGYKGTDKFITSDTLSGLQSGALRQDPQNLSRIYDPNAPVPTPKLPRETASSVYDSPLPLGIRQLQAGRSLGAPRGQLRRTAGIALPSAQARRRMLPSEREAFEGLGRMAGIPAGEFQQELGITTPSGSPRTGNARMLPLSLRR